MSEVDASARWRVNPASALPSARLSAAQPTSATCTHPTPTRIGYYYAPPAYYARRLTAVVEADDVGDVMWLGRRGLDGQRRRMLGDMAPGYGYTGERGIAHCHQLCLLAQRSWAGLKAAQQQHPRAADDAPLPDQH